MMHHLGAEQSREPTQPQQLRVLVPVARVVRGVAEIGLVRAIAHHRLLLQVVGTSAVSVVGLVVRETS